MFEHLKAGSQDPNLSRTPVQAGPEPASLKDLTELLLRDPDAHAAWVLKEVERFSSVFPELTTRQAPMPRFTWEQLERQLMFLAGTPQRQAMVSDRVAAIRKSSGRKAEEMILQEILIEAWVLLDEEPHGSLEEQKD